MIFFIRKVYWFCLVSLAFSCQQKENKPTESAAPKELIPDRNEYAKGFSLSYGSDFTLLEIFSPFQDAEDTLKYILQSKENDIPTGYSEYNLIRVPVEKMVLTSTTHLAMMTHLGRSEAICAVTDPDFIYDSKIKDAIEKGKIAEAGRNGQINLETVLALNTGLVMSGAWSTTAYEKYTPLINAGIPVMVNAEWTEPHPLGRMEWLKVFGALLGEKEKANKLFEESKTAYLSLADLVSKADLNKPTVINGLPYQEAWSIAGGNSYVGKLFKDAGADWHWANDTSSVSLQLDFETVYQVGEQADIWIAPGRTVHLSEILTIDNRFENFKSFQKGLVYNYHNRINEAGLYDFYESGIIKPEIILADLVKIFHPTLLPKHEFYYFKKMN